MLGETMHWQFTIDAWTKLYLEDGIFIYIILLIPISHKCIPMGVMDDKLVDELGCVLAGRRKGDMFIPEPNKFYEAIRHH